MKLNTFLNNTIHNRQAARILLALYQELKFITHENEPIDEIEDLYLLCTMADAGEEDYQKQAFNILLHFTNLIANKHGDFSWLSNNKEVDRRAKMAMLVDKEYVDQIEQTTNLNREQFVKDFEQDTSQEAVHAKLSMKLGTLLDQIAKILQNQPNSNLQSLYSDIKKQYMYEELDNDQLQKQITILESILAPMPGTQLMTRRHKRKRPISRRFRKPIRKRI